MHERIRHYKRRILSSGRSNCHNDDCCPRGNIFMRLLDGDWWLGRSLYEFTRFCQGIDTNEFHGGNSVRGR